CVDLGENHGDYSLVLADLCDAEVFAFEPQEHLAELIVKSANVCGFARRISVIQKAVGSSEGYATLDYPSTDNQGGVHCELQGGRYDGPVGELVHVVTLETDR